MNIEKMIFSRKNSYSSGSMLHKYDYIYTGLEEIHVDIIEDPCFIMLPYPIYREIKYTSIADKVDNDKLNDLIYQLNNAEIFNNKTFQQTQGIHPLINSVEKYVQVKGAPGREWQIKHVLMKDLEDLLGPFKKENGILKGEYGDVYRLNSNIYVKIDMNPENTERKPRVLLTAHMDSVAACVKASAGDEPLTMEDGGTNKKLLLTASGGTWGPPWENREVDLHVPFEGVIVKDNKGNVRKYCVELILDSMVNTDNEIHHMHDYEFFSAPQQLGRADIPNPQVSDFFETFPRDPEVQIMLEDKEGILPLCYVTFKSNEYVSIKKTNEVMHAPNLDDRIGVATNLALIKHMIGVKKRRKVREKYWGKKLNGIMYFGFTSNEETGMHGAKQLVNKLLGFRELPDVHLALDVYPVESWRSVAWKPFKSMESWIAPGSLPVVPTDTNYSLGGSTRLIQLLRTCCEEFDHYLQKKYEIIGKEAKKIKFLYDTAETSGEVTEENLYTISKLRREKEDELRSIVRQVVTFMTTRDTPIYGGGEHHTVAETSGCESLFIGVPIQGVHGIGTVKFNSIRKNYMLFKIFLPYLLEHFDDLGMNLI